jgi:two-component system, chemotaxis family, CheB/CheR fusion protein
LISAEYEILKFLGDTRPYLAQSPGKASLNLLKMLREGLLVGLRAALIQSTKGGTPVREEGLLVKSDDAYREVTVEVIPLKGSESTRGGFLVLFEEVAPSGPNPSRTQDHSQGPEPRSDPRIAERTATESANLVIARLSQELDATREYVQSSIGQQEAANEELLSANEEVQSRNEELQSTNEELETSKEEIQSSNEELATLNAELNNRNAELDRLNNDLLNVLSSVETPIVILGPDFRIRRFTPAAEQLLNLSPHDVGRPIGSIKLGIPIADLEPLLQEVRGTGTTKQREVRDEQGRWYSLRIRPYRTLDNRVDGVVVMMVDVDTLKRAQEYTESIVSTLRESLLVLGSDLRVRTASRSFYETFGVTPEATEGRPFFELDNGRWADPDLRRLLEEVVSRDSNFTDFEVHQALEHGPKKVLLLNARRLIQEGGRSPWILLAIQDVTELKRVEQALRDGDLRKNQFLAMLAHELRNPLAAVSYAEQVLHAPGMEAMQGWSKEVIGRQVRHLSRLIDDLLDVSRITQGKITLRMQLVSLSSVIARSVEMTRYLVDEKKHHLTVSVEPETMTLEADPTRLEQILSNLIMNAAKYTEEGGRISLTARPEAGVCVVKVTDNGQGLAAEMLPHVFDLFTQVGNTLHRAKGGLGIGLTLVKKLAELHGGNVQVRSQGIGHGSEFTVRIPMHGSSVPETPPPAAKSVNAPFRKSRILIVEDSLDMARGMATQLETIGHEVGMVHDGPSAVEVARAQRFDFILLDIGLPGLSGYEVASELRKGGSCKESVIIAISGYGQEEDRRRSRESGINHHLVKPIEHNSLLTLLSQAH